MPRSRDLFDDTTMSFGEHLEVLRVHVWRALVGAAIAIAVSLFYGDRVFSVLRAPIEEVLISRGIQGIENDAPTEDLWTYMKRWWNGESDPEEKAPEPASMDSLKPDELRVTISRAELERQGLFSKPGQAQDTPTSTGEETSAQNQNSSVSIVIAAPEFAQLQRVVRDMNRVTTLKAEEGFITYIKVCTIAGLLISSPWIFYQIWLFVAAGLHPHERKYIYVYLPLSLFLFVAGALAGFYYAFPLMLKFFVAFNEWLNIVLQPRLSEYISLALVMPLMFGISFQLPMGMLFLERINIFTVDAYKKNIRMAVLVISILSMLLTPADPGSMLLMMVPLIFLYYFGILLCGMRVKTPPAPIR
ncbi:MAG: twin-arginine translocase subunit TatC [Planctomycetaceae bacterium]|nr:twin-arginine translocase subunit TatC [Planctomycetaceae bacterium]